MSTAHLDLAEFEKLRELMTVAAPSEQVRARLKARMMARAAGLTLEQAIAEADKAKGAPPASEAPEVFPAAGKNPWGKRPSDRGPPSLAEPPGSPLQALSDAFSTPEARTFLADRQKARQARQREVLEAYGSEEAVFAETEREAALRVGCQPLVSPESRPGLPSLLGWGPSGSRSTVPQMLLLVVSQAWPLPATVQEAWAEMSEAEKLATDRETVHEVEYHPPGWIEARRYVIEDLLDTLPAPGLADVLARILWMEHLNERGYVRDVNDDAKLLATLRADVERLAVQSGEGSGVSVPNPGSATVQSGQQEPPAPQRTASDRRKAVLTLLADPATAELSDREIARRAGVSPQTVCTWRQRAREDRP